MPSGVTWDDRLVLESFDLHAGVSDRRPTAAAVEIDKPKGAADLRVGETLQVDLLWRSLRAHPGRFTVSVSLEDELGRAWATRASEPVDRMYPSWMWSGNEQVRDQLRMPVPAEPPPGRYQLRPALLEQGRPVPIQAAAVPPTTCARPADVALSAPGARAVAPPAPAA